MDKPPTQPKIFADHEASKEFLDVWHHFGSACVTCAPCGRTYFNDTDRGCFDEGELERYRDLEKSGDGTYIGVDGGATFAEILGRPTVIGCVCHYDAFVEDILWGNRMPIAKFLKTRIARELKDARKESALVDGLDHLSDDPFEVEPKPPGSGGYRRRKKESKP